MGIVKLSDFDFRGLFGKEELNLNGKGPVGPKRWVRHLEKRLRLCMFWLLMNFPQFPHSAAKRNNPFIPTGSFPIDGDDGG